MNIKCCLCAALIENAMWLPIKCSSSSSNTSNNNNSNKSNDEGDDNNNSFGITSVATAKLPANITMQMSSGHWQRFCFDAIRGV